jgi:DNA-binding response OmpR family regulator
MSKESDAGRVDAVVPAARAAAPTRILVVDDDPALVGLLDEWLAAHGCSVVQEGSHAQGAGDRFDLVIVDVAFPRQNGLSLLQRIAREHPGAPMLALSSTFFASVECSGDVARSLGVASVLPKPVMRDALISAVRNLLRK